MAFDAIRSIFDSPSIVVLFALLVMVFAVFVGLGLYAATRESRRSAAARQQASTVVRRPRRERRVLPRIPPDPARDALFRSRRELNHSQETS